VLIVFSFHNLYYTTFWLCPDLDRTTLGHQVSKRTVRKYMQQARRDLPPRRSGQTWATFLKNHASEI
jgi:hypothetical protein